MAEIGNCRRRVVPVEMTCFVDASEFSFRIFYASSVDLIRKEDGMSSPDGLEVKVIYCHCDTSHRCTLCTKCDLCLLPITLVSSLL